MRIKDKINLDRFGLDEEGPITIVAFGDSVTHGSFEIGQPNDYEAVYWNVLRKKILEVKNYVPVNVINAGIGGTTAYASVKRMEKQVLCHMPDLIIVCFGLNDINDELDAFLSALGTIFEKSLASGAEVIYMSPNMLNTYVADDTLEQFKKYAGETAEYQTSGKMDLYINSAVELARSMGVKVCDCYAKWKKLSETQDTTQLLANKINHPTREMHKLFADSLFDVIFDDVCVKESDNNTMYAG